MEKRPPADLNSQFRALFGEGRLADLSEGQLLDRFLTRRDEVAFEELIARHGPMVLGVCRRWLADPNDVNDAFQATFLILLRKGRSLRDRKTLSHWLYGVSQRVARRARSQAARRRERLISTSRDAPTSRTAQEEAAGRELLAIVDDEIRRLPEKQQAVAVLCLVQGWTHEEAARALEWPLGTVKSRLATARDTLRGRLSRRGLDAPDGLLAAIPLSCRLAPAATIGRLSRLTQLAIECVDPAASPGTAATAGALELSRGVLRTMLWKQLLVGTACAILALSTAGVAALAYQREGQDPAPVQGGRSRAADRPIELQKAEQPVRRDILRIAYEQAERFVRTIEDPAERAEHLLSLGIARTRQGSLPEAKAILNEAVSAAAKIPEDSRYISPHPIIRIAEAQAKAGDHEAAHWTFQRAVQIMSSGKRGSYYNDWFNLLPIQVATEGRARMAHTFAAYRQFVENGEYFGDSDRDDLAVLRAAESGSTDAVLKVINSPEFGSSSNNPERRRIDGLLKAVACFGPEERDRVRPLLSEARKSIGANTDRMIRTGQLRNLAVEEARLGLFADAVASAASIVPEDYPAQPSHGGGIFQKSLALLDIADHQIRVGDRDGARSTVRKALVVIDATKDESFRTIPIARAADVQVQSDDSVGARRTIDRIKHQDVAIYKLRELAHRQAKAGDRAAAMASWTHALELAAAGFPTTSYHDCEDSNRDGRPRIGAPNGGHDP